jgi:hypothetical protein
MSPLPDHEGGPVLTDLAEPPPAWADLTLPALRAYRRGLTDEEEKVSYWRRLVHARIDVLEAESRQERPLRLEELIRVLGDTGTGRARTALVKVRAADDLPELPVLADMWVTEVDPDDPAAIAEAVTRLRAAEKTLTEYRRALHERLDACTAELIERYRENPTAALAAFAAPYSGGQRVGGAR